MSSNDGFMILLSLNSTEVNFILAESYKLENTEALAHLETQDIRRALEAYSSDQLRAPFTTNFSHSFSLDELKWLYRLIRRTTSSDYGALRVYLSNKFECLAEDLMQRRLSSPIVADS